MRCNIAIMKRFLPIIILLITHILSSQVMSPAEYKLKKDMIGKHYSNVIQMLGPYHSKSEDGLGGIIYVWRSPSDEMQFFCDSDGIIYNVRYLETTAPYNDNWIYCLLLILLYFYLSTPTSDMFPEPTLP